MGNGFICIESDDPRTTANERIRGPRGVSAPLVIIAWMNHQILAITLVPDLGEDIPHD